MFGSKKRKIEEQQREIQNLQGKITGLQLENNAKEQEYVHIIENLKSELFSARNKNYHLTHKNKSDIFYGADDKINELTAQLNAEKKHNNSLEAKIKVFEKHNKSFEIDEYLRIKNELNKCNATILELQKKHIEEKNQIIEDFKTRLNNKPDEQTKEIRRLRKRISELTEEILKLKESPEVPVQYPATPKPIISPPSNINALDELNGIKANYKKEISDLIERLNDLDTLDKSLVKNEFADIMLYYSWKEISLLADSSYKYIGIKRYSSDYKTFDELKESMKNRFFTAISDQYKYKFILQLYPEFNMIFNTNTVNKKCAFKIKDIRRRTEHLLNVAELVNTLDSLPDYNGPTKIMREKIEILTRKAYGTTLHSDKTLLELQADNQKLKQENTLLSQKYTLLDSKTNLSAIPYMAKLIADFETYELERLAKSLEWGNSKERANKVKSIREIRKDTKAMIEKYKEAEYQLAYLLQLYPVLEEVIECEFKELPTIEFNELSQTDNAKAYLSKDEYNALTTTERNQLALDRYKSSHKKSKWQIGRDYEQYIGYLYIQKGYEVDNFGTYMGLEDLGRDIIAKKNDFILIIQCKYWSSVKQIHEKHITQLHGTVASYCVENDVPKTKVKGLLVTNIKLSNMAKKMANHLEIDFEENVPIGDYPCIKCNIGHDPEGNRTKIYHLPFDQQYDNTKIEPHKGEFYAVTVKEAEDAGFRRAFKHFN